MGSPFLKAECEFCGCEIKLLEPSRLCSDCNGKNKTDLFAKKERHEWLKHLRDNPRDGFNISDTDRIELLELEVEELRNRINTDHEHLWNHGHR